MAARRPIIASSIESTVECGALGPIGFVDLPANVNHFAFAPVETVIQISTEGPFGIKYANASDDPSKSQ